MMEENETQTEKEYIIYVFVIKKRKSHPTIFLLHTDKASVTKMSTEQRMEKHKFPSIYINKHLHNSNPIPQGKLKRKKNEP